MAKGYRKSSTSGSHAHHGERTGRGQSTGAGQVSAGGPGPAAMKVKPHMSAANFTNGPGTPPKGMKIYSQGE